MTDDCWLQKAWCVVCIRNEAPEGGVHSPPEKSGTNVFSLVLQQLKYKHSSI